MEWTFWTLHLDPGVGWIVRRWVKKGTTWPILHAEFDRLTRREAADVLDADSSYVLDQAMTGDWPPSEG